jgi:hypothetical protein
MTTFELVFKQVLRPKKKKMRIAGLIMYLEIMTYLEHSAPGGRGFSSGPGVVGVLALFVLDSN